MTSFHRLHAGDAMDMKSPETTPGPASTALIPCGHCFCCRPECGSHDVEICPSCRAPIESRTVLFGALQPSSQHAQLVDLAASLGAAVARTDAAPGASGGGHVSCDKLEVQT